MGDGRRDDGGEDGWEQENAARGLVNGLALSLLLWPLILAMAYALRY